MTAVSKEVSVSPQGDLGRPRQKAFHRKSRRGCQTCRTRRVRCDEQRPTCKACSRLQHNCVYFDSITRPVFGSALDSLTPARVPLAVLTPFVDESEWRYYRLFEDSHLKWYETSQYGDDDLCLKIWPQLFLPLMHRNALFKHIILALSAAQTFSNPDGTVVPIYAGVPSLHETFFLHHFGHVLRLMMEAQQRQETTLIMTAALTLCVIEACRHRPEQLLCHMNSGLGLLEQWLDPEYAGLDYADCIGHAAMFDLVLPAYSSLQKNQYRIVKEISAVRIQ